MADDPAAGTAADPLKAARPSGGQAPRLVGGDARPRTGPVEPANGRSPERWTDPVRAVGTAARPAAEAAARLRQTVGPRGRGRPGNDGPGQSCRRRGRRASESTPGKAIQCKFAALFWASTRPKTLRHAPSTVWGGGRPKRVGLVMPSDRLPLAASGHSGQALGGGGGSTPSDGRAPGAGSARKRPGYDSWQSRRRRDSAAGKAGLRVDPGEGDSMQ